MTQQMLARNEKQQAVAKRNPIGELASFLEGRKNEIVKVLPEGLSVERVVKTAVMAAMENPDIGQRCTPLSIYRSVIQASLMGLTVGSGFNEGYFIRYGDSCTFRASYLGWSKVAIRSDGIDLIRASVVYSNDDLDISEQPPAVTHKPRWVSGSRGDVVGALACAYTLRTDVDGKSYHDLFDFTFVPPEDLAAAKKLADQRKESPAWRSWPNEMRKKVAIRRLCKLLPRNDALSKLTHIENNADQGIVGVPDPEALPETDNLNEMIVDSRFDSGRNQLQAPEPEIIDAPPPEPEPEKKSKPEPVEKQEPKASKSSRLKGRLGGSKKQQKEAPPPPPPPDQDEIPDYGVPEQTDIEF